MNGGLTEVNRTLERFWNIEEPVNTAPLMSSEEQDAYDIVNSSLCRSAADATKYQVTMPWKASTSDIRSNIESARKRLVNTEKTLEKRQLGDAYKSVISQYLEKGYIRRIEKDDKTGRWYLPHFAIRRPDKATTKTGSFLMPVLVTEMRV